MDVCRLCATKKASRYFVAAIDDEIIEEKLIACCRWNSIGVSDYVHLKLPKTICRPCLVNLEKCWIFAEKVAFAQEFLLSHNVGIKTEVFVSDGIHKVPDEIDDESVELNTSNAYLPVEYEEYYPDQREIDEYLQSVDDNANISRKARTKALSENQCTICGKKLSSRANLITHEKIHMSKETRRHFECYICKSKFSYKKSLNQHMPIHCGKKVEHQCGVCRLRFTRLDSLKRHTLIHMGQYPHECQMCGKGFRTKFHLQTHERSHTGDRPFPCQSCRFRASTQSNLERHIRNKHKKKTPHDVN